MKKVYLNTPEEVIKALKEGKEIFLEEGGAGKVKLIDGFCVKEFNDQFNINYTINLRDKPFVYEQETLKIEVGKFYKTREGRKAFVFAESRFKNENYVFAYVIIGGIEEVLHYIQDGHYFCDGEENGYDLVAPWED